MDAPGSEHLVYTCPSCYAGTLGRYPHADGQPCPLVLARDAAYVEKLEAERDAALAQRDYYERAQMPMLDQSEASRLTSRFLHGMLGDDDVGD